MAGKLTELQVKNAKAKAAKYTMAGGGGLTLLVTPDGSKYWRLRYRIGGRPRMISVGKPYPVTSLKQAQAQAVEFRALIDQGIDPADTRRLDKLATKKRVANTSGARPGTLKPATRRGSIWTRTCCPGSAAVRSTASRLPNWAR
jgi:Arm DNA-binding domain